MKFNAVLFDWGQTLKGSGPTPQFLRSLIPDLYNSGYRIGIVSNSHRYGDARWLRQQLCLLDWSQFIEVVIGSGGTLGPGPGLHKPDELIYFRAINFLGVAPEKTVFVGDSQRCDVDAPEKIGMTGLLVDVDNGDYSRDLWAVLEDQPTFRHVITTYDWFAAYERNDIYRSSVSGADAGGISLELRCLSEPVCPGHLIMVGTEEYRVKNVSFSHTKDDILDLRDKGRRTIEIYLKLT